MTNWQAEIDELGRRRRIAYEMGGAERVEEQHHRGKLTVRERVAALLDPDSFREHGLLAGSVEYDGAEVKDFRPSGFVTGRGTIDGRPVVVGGGDITARARPMSGGGGGGGVGGGGGNKSHYSEKMALGLKVPLIRLIDGFGADVRIVESIGRTYISSYDHWMTYTQLMEVVPVVSAALGAVAGLPAAQVGMSHFAIMVRGISQVFAGGPPLVQRALGHTVSKEELGGVEIHAHQSGLIDNVAESEADAFQQIRRFISFLPTNIWELPPVLPSDDPIGRRDEALLGLIPRNRMRPYDVRTMVSLIVDQGSAFELGRDYGASQVTMLARLAGRPVGVLANDPLHIGGAMDADSAQKLEKFVSMCDQFHLPVVNFTDQPGFMVGPAAEAAGTLKHGARAIRAIFTASIPWASVVVRRAYGVAGGTQQNHARWNLRVAWPSGEWGSIPIEGGIAAAYRRQIEAAPDPKAYMQQLEDELRALRSPFRTAEAFNMEDIIDPRETRPLLCEWVELAYRQLPSLIPVRGRGV